MDGVDNGLWRTLARVYTTVVACGVCVPALAAIPALAGFDSFVPTLVFGVLGLGLASVVTFLVDARLDTLASQRLSEALDADVAAADAPRDAASDSSST